jgi:hypothetical protein
MYRVYYQTPVGEWCLHTETPSVEEARRAAWYLLEACGEVVRLEHDRVAAPAFRGTTGG